MPVPRWRIFLTWYYLDNRGKFCYNTREAMIPASKESKGVRKVMAGNTKRIKRKREWHP